MRLLLVLLLLASTDPKLTLYPQVVQAGQNVRLTCRVPRYAANRELTYGFDNWSVSTRPLEGENARITWEVIFPFVPCDPGRAFCEVRRVGERSVMVSTTLVVAGCDDLPR